MPSRRTIIAFSGLDVILQIGLPVLETQREISRMFRFPEERKILSRTFMRINPIDRSPQSALALKENSQLASWLGGSTSVRRRISKDVKFSEFKIVVQNQRKNVGLRNGKRVLRTNQGYRGN